MTQRKQNAEPLMQAVVNGMLERKAKDITILDLRHVPKAIADYFIICTGTSDTHVDSIFNSVEKQTMQEANEGPWHVEGTENREWILADYVDVVAHIFQREKRERFGLEELWGDAKITHLGEGVNTSAQR